MGDELAQRVGQRVRFARQANRQTQAVVAGLSGITTDYLYQIERGKKLPTVPVLLAISKALRIPAATLLGEGEASPSPASPPSDAAQAIHRALTLPLPRSEPSNTAMLRDRVHSAWECWQHSPQRYTELSRVLPRLITDTELSLRRTTEKGGDRQVCAVELYSLVRTVAKRLGRTDSALLAADRATRAAEDVDRPLPRAAAAWNLAHVLLADSQVEGAEAVAMQALDELNAESGGTTLDGLALQGALLSVAAVASARLGKPWPARDRLREAGKLATTTGERNTAWTAFGPTNVAMHAVSIEVETGEIGEALRLAERIQPPATLSIERRVAFLLEQAKGYGQRQDYGSALVTLQAASFEAPEDITYRPAARTVLQTIVQRGRVTVAQQGAALATRFDISV
jgi:transcriptional regulator with XRE-family HTH domain